MAMTVFARSESLTGLHSILSHKNMKRRIVFRVGMTLGLTCVLQTACVGPLVSDESARTVGYHRSEVVGGIGQAGEVVKYTFGLGDKLDVGAQWESLSIGLRLKYALLDEQEKVRQKIRDTYGVDIRDPKRMKRASVSGERKFEGLARLEKRP